MTNLVIEIHSEQTSVVMRSRIELTVLSCHEKTKRAELPPGPLSEQHPLPVIQADLVLSQRQRHKAIALMQLRFMNTPHCILARLLQATAATLTAGKRPTEPALDLSPGRIASH